MPKPIITSRYSLYPEQIRPDSRIILRIHQINRPRIKPCPFIRKDEHLVALHREQELPPLVSIIFFVNDRKSSGLSPHRLIERNYVFLNIPVRILEYCRVVVVPEIDIVRWNMISFCVADDTPEIIPLDPDRVKVEILGYGHTFQDNTFLLVEPDRILVQIHERFLWIVTKLSQPVFEDAAHSSVHNLLNTKAWINVFPDGIYIHETHTLDFRRDLARMIGIKPNRILIQ